MKSARGYTLDYHHSHLVRHQGITLIFVFISTEIVCSILVLLRRNQLKLKKYEDTGE